MNATSPATPSSFAPAPIALRARDVADLAVSTGYPCISVLLPTEPARRMTPADLGRLQALVAEVDQELQEHGVTSRARLLRKLADQMRRSAAQPTYRALAIYVSLAVSRAFRLPQPVPSRVVVEPTFATRALVSALHRMPPHVVLDLQPTGADLYAAADGGLRPVGRCTPERTSAHLREVDRMLGDYRAEHPGPLVLAGSPHLLDHFCGLSRNLDRLAGRVAPGDQQTVLDLALASAEAVESYLRTRREDALDQLDHALRHRPVDVASGIDRCWRSLQVRAPGMLLVEEGYTSPGASRELSGAGSGTRRGEAGAGLVHDLVDDLMEQVVLRGGQLALVRDGELTAHDRIALISRGTRRG
ncbi:hypothetical protein GCM10009844_17010 [Nocardioides koreensis]|uniref:Uncharacterized protein n=1 Tax=Nocardioides koreensis TaxID=433651 RepID=A0ABP5LEJ0_9ACTN